MESVEIVEDEKRTRQKLRKNGVHTRRETRKEEVSQGMTKQRKKKNEGVALAKFMLKAGKELRWVPEVEGNRKYERKRCV